MLASYKAFSLLLNQYEYQHSILGIDPSYSSGGNKPMTDRGSMVALKFDREFGLRTHVVADVDMDFFKRDWASNTDGSEALVLWGSRLSGRARINYELTRRFDAEAGLELERRMNAHHQAYDMVADTLIRSNLAAPHHIDQFSAFAQLHGRFRFLNIIGGARYTYYDVSANDLSGRISVLAELNKANSIKLIFGQSFRAPTMLELYFDHPTVVGNANLKPEKANSIELAYVYGRQHFYFQSLIYYNSLQQLIQRYTPETGPPSEYRNIAGMESAGIEFEAKYRHPRWFSAFVNYNYMKGLGSEAKSNFRHVPLHTLKFGMSRSFNKLFLSYNGYLISDVTGNPDLRRTIPPQFFARRASGLQPATDRQKSATSSYPEP